jgi:beta-1,4-mannosyl-glycoprotein beta-1,4-N-acetylglucosaminyltransferase
MKIIDCFTFFNELDLLEFRLRLLDSHVDHFVIAESNLTHSGKTKPYHFEAHKDRFTPWLNKITYIPLQQSTDGLDISKPETGYNPGSAAWKLENEQRNALSAATALAGEDDLVLISDLDEIPNPFLIKKVNLEDGPVVLSMLFHYYYLNCQNMGAERWWNGTILCTGKQFAGITPQQLRDNRNVYKSIPKAGWHFSFLGGPEKIKYKIQSFAHTEFNKDEYLNEDQILEAIKEGKDIFNRPGTSYKFVSLYFYPDYLRSVMALYPSFLHIKNKDSLFTRIFYTVKNISG